MRLRAGDVFGIEALVEIDRGIDAAHDFRGTAGKATAPQRIRRLLRAGHRRPIREWRWALQKPPKLCSTPPLFILSPCRPGGEGGVRGADVPVPGPTHLTLPSLSDGPLPLPPEGRRGALTTDFGPAA